MQLIDHQIRLQLPSWWPRSLRPEALNQMDHPTPFLVCDLETARERYTHLTLALPGVHCFYAVKCNSEPELLAAFDQLGSSFEIASCAELQMLQKLGVDPEKVLYSNTVKPAAHIAESFAAGLWRYAFDSEGELYKLAQHAPGAAVYVRLRVDDSTSLVPLSRKFGAEAQEARALMLLARSLGLRPYGVTFHVGSQCTTTTAWRQAIAAVGRLLSRLSGDGITLEMLNLGGGFPARYVEDVPSVDQIANTIESALHELLPYRPELLAVEPGRFLVAESAVLVAGSLAGRSGRARTGPTWTSAPTTG
jgi:ornithine decarboxylase